MTDEQLPLGTAESRDKRQEGRALESQVSGRLLRSGMRFARSAIDAYVREDWEVFYLHMSTAVEQLLKCELATLNPVLIAEKAGDFETLLHLTGNSQLAKTPESAVRTIGVGEALRRVQQIQPAFKAPTSRIAYLLEMRNGVVHAGHTVRAEHQAVLGEVASFLEPYWTARGISPTLAWGPHADLVLDHAQRRIGELEASYTRRVRAARESYQQVFQELSDEEQVAYLEAREPSEWADEYDQGRAECPSCGYLGLLKGVPEPQWEADWDTEGGQAYVSGAYVSSIRLYGSTFHCEVCRLSLEADLLSFAGMATLDLSEDDVDLDSATQFFTRQLADDAGGY